MREVLNGSLHAEAMDCMTHGYGEASTQNTMLKVLIVIFLEKIYNLQWFVFLIMLERIAMKQSFRALIEDLNRQLSSYLSFVAEF